MSRTGVRNGSLALVGILFGFCSIAGLRALRTTDTPSTTTLAQQETIFGGTDQPCGGTAEKTTPEEARQHVPYRLLTPTDDLANPRSMSAFWRCSTTEIEMDFSSGIRVYEDVNLAENPAVTWAAMAAEDPSYTSVGEVRGQPAALIDPMKDPYDTVNGSVSLVDDDTWIVVEGNGRISIQALQRVANSLQG